MDELGLNVPVLVANLVNFFLLLVLLRIFLYKPILNMLAQRTKRVQEGLEAAEQSKERAEQADQEVAQQLEQARQQSQTNITKAQEAARSQARRDAEVLLERARSEIQLERDQAIAELRREFADLTVSAAEKVIGQSLDHQAHRRLIDEVLAESTFREG